MKTHKEKVKIGRALMSKAELTTKRKGMFDTTGWNDRRARIAKRAKADQDAAHARAEARKAGSDGGKMSTISRTVRLIREARQRRIDARKRRNEAHARRTAKA